MVNYCNNLVGNLKFIVLALTINQISKIQIENNNIIIYHNEEPLCSAQLVAYLLSKELTPDIMIFLGWATFYMYGLWDNRGRAELQSIANGANDILPWLSEKEQIKIHWYPTRLKSDRQIILLRQQYDHWFKLCYKNSFYYVDKSEEKGLLLKCNYPGGLQLRDIFDSENPGLLIALSKSFKKDIEKIGFDSIYEVRKDYIGRSGGGYKHFALIGPESLLNHDMTVGGSLMHIEDNSRSLLMEVKSIQYVHHYPSGILDGDGHMLKEHFFSYDPLQVNQQTCPDGRLTQEELNDNRQTVDRSIDYQPNYRDNCARIISRAVLRSTFIVDWTNRRFKFNDELVIKYADQGYMGRNNNSKKRSLEQM